jgi:hypothetical protein
MGSSHRVLGGCRFVRSTWRPSLTSRKLAGRLHIRRLQPESLDRYGLVSIDIQVTTYSREYRALPTEYASLIVVDGVVPLPQVAIDSE